MSFTNTRWRIDILQDVFLIYVFILLMCPLCDFFHIHVFNHKMKMILFFCKTWFQKFILQNRIIFFTNTRSNIILFKTWLQISFYKHEMKWSFQTRVQNSFLQTQTEIIISNTSSKFFFTNMIFSQNTKWKYKHKYVLVCWYSVSSYDMKHTKYVLYVGRSLKTDLKTHLFIFGFHGLSE